MLQNGVYNDRQMRAADRFVNGRPGCKCCHGLGRTGFYNGDMSKPVPCPRCKKAREPVTPAETPLSGKP